MKSFAGVMSISDGHRGSGDPAAVEDGYGKGGEIASNRRDEQEMFVLCLHILQSALVYVFSRLSR
ncbi:hypothetical protein ACFVH0_21520 [Streptomyces sp. NPDC127117]|uniref:hypothetical protein n=1 Tax=Streptomyces sp. NPDC127117 TaxID=3345368 RepID=UPI003625A3D2